MLNISDSNSYNKLITLAGSLSNKEAKKFKSDIGLVKFYSSRSIKNL